MRLISSQEIRKLLPMKDAIEVTKQAFSIFSNGKSVVPLRTHISVPQHNGTCLFMPAFLPELDVAGIKIVSVFPDNAKKGKPSIPASVLLLDATTGEVVAIMEGGELTRLRTGAASGAATDLLARKDASIGALFGTGGQGPAQLEAIITARNLKEVRIFDPARERAEAFVEKVSKEAFTDGVKIVIAESSEEAVTDADVITTVTTAHKPVFDARHLKKGAHVNAVGSYQPHVQETDPALLELADMIFVDSKEAVLEESGDFIQPINEGRFDPETINGELGFLYDGKLTGRTSDDQITFFKTVGIAVQDVLAARAVFNRAIETETGMEVSL